MVPFSLQKGRSWPTGEFHSTPNTTGHGGEHGSVSFSGLARLQSGAK